MPHFSNADTGQLLNVRNVTQRQNCQKGKTGKTLPVKKVAVDLKKHDKLFYDLGRTAVRKMIRAAGYLKGLPWRFQATRQRPYSTSKT